MSELNVALALIGGLTLLLEMGTGYLESRGYLPSEPMLAVLFGVAIGPLGLDAFRLATWGDPLRIIEEAARLTVAIAVTSIALRLPKSYFRRRLRSMAALLGLGMLLMWLASSLVTYAVLQIPVVVAVLVGAVVTPTDPVLANSVVVGGAAEQNIPKRIRYLLSAEAAANDGGAYPFVFLAILLSSRAAETALVEWATRTVLLEVFGAVLLGAAIGAGVGYIERWVSGKQYLEVTPVLTITVALTFAVVGLVTVLGLNEILAVFVAGLAYNVMADPGDEAREQQVEEVFNRLFTLPVFVLFGMVLPLEAWMALGWSGTALVVGILLLRRIPMMLAVRRFVRPLDRTAATLFAGWFGPIGIAALYYATLAVHETGNETVWTVVSLLAMGSILVHGATETLFTLRYGDLGDDADWW